MSFLNTKHKKKSFTLTTLLFSALLLLLFYIGLTYMDPVEEKGIAVNFGQMDFGKGDVQPKEKIKSEPIKTVKEVVEEVVVVEVVEPVVEPVIVPEEATPAVPAFTDSDKTEVVENYEEEVFEEFEDFDEDKYNEYMDTYEDQYKD